MRTHKTWLAARALVCGAAIFVEGGGRLSCVARAQDGPAGEGSRQFQFHYGATVGGLTPGEQCRIWVPVASSNAHQEVRLLQKPEDAQLATEPRYGNSILYVDRVVPAEGKVDLDLVYDVKRMADHGGVGPAVPDANDARYLQPDAKVPVGGLAMQLLAGKTLATDQAALARQLYDVVYDHMTYRKDKPGWGTGDSNWACTSGYGNCTDFHSLFISLCRGKGIPAKFEIGFMIPAEGKGAVAGYHCWAQCKPAGADGAMGEWVPVDISDASQHPEKRGKTFGVIDENRVMFSTGRDLQLAPAQAAGPVNFLIYPYVEVAGKVWPQEKIAKRFAFESEPMK